MIKFRIINQCKVVFYQSKKNFNSKLMYQSS